jgi:hypothetical protein
MQLRYTGRRNCGYATMVGTTQGQQDNSDEKQHARKALGAISRLLKRVAA